MIGNFKTEGKALIILLNMISSCLLLLFIIFPIIGLFFQKEHWLSYVELQKFLLCPWESLSLTEYALSGQAKQHFLDVKNYVMALEIVSVLLTPWSCYIFYRDMYQGYCYTWIQRLKYWIKGELWILILVLLFGFNQSFILFHRLLFRNAYWIFDRDAIIELFPTSFFVVLLCIGLIVFNSLCLCLYIISKRKDCS